MRKKLKDSGGFTIVEMLCVVAILVLLCLMVNSGLSLAMRSYRDMVAESETQLLLNDLSDAMADKLRYAIVTVKQKEETTGGTVTITTEKCTFSLENVKLEDSGKVTNIWKLKTDTEAAKEGWISDAGQVYMDGKKLLSSGAYGSELSDESRRYVVETVDVIWDNDLNSATSPMKNDLREGQILTFHITLKVKDRWGPVSEEKKLTVRCMNPVKKEV